MTQRAHSHVIHVIMIVARQFHTTRLLPESKENSGIVVFIS